MGHYHSPHNTEGSRPDSGEDDQRCLDRAFDVMLQAVEEGRDADPTPFLNGFEHLAPQFDALAELAREVAIGPVNAAALPRADGYVVLSLLGRGGMSAVYLAQQTSLGGRIVALKVLPQMLASASTRERFKREAFAIAQLKHPNIISAHDVVRTDQSFAYTMEYVSGGSLQKVIEHVQESTVPLDAVHESLSVKAPLVLESTYARTIARWGMAIADALHTMHTAGLIHRDVKPSNILIRSDGTPLLSDFGLVFQTNQDTLTLPGAFAGTLCYAAPEQLRGEFHQLSPRADVYALGATLYHALALRMPFAGRSAVQVLKAIEAGPPESLSRHAPSASLKVPADLDTIVRKALAPEPSQRYESASALAMDLERFLSDRPIVARRATLRYRCGKFIRRNRRDLAAATVAGVVVLAAAVAITAKIFLLPQWSQESLSRARMHPHVLSDAPAESGRSPHDILFSMSFWQFEGPVGYGPGPLSDPVAVAVRQRLERTVSLYDQAILYGEPSGRAVAERQAVLMALASRYGADSGNSAIIGTPSALAQQYLTFRETVARKAGARPGYRLGERVPVLGPDILTHAAVDELRQLGLLAYLMSDAYNARDAWVELERRDEDDPFVAGMLGILYLIDEQPDLAYPRLRSAMIAFPDAVHFTMFTADAASRIGDSVKARQYLASAIRMPGCDDGAAFRIGLVIRVAEGDIDGAMQEVRREYCTPGARESAVLSYQLSKLMERAGREELAVEMATLSASDSVPARKAMLQLRHVANAWWSGLTPQQQLELARRTLEPATMEACDWRDRFFIAMCACESFEVDSTPEWKAISVRQQAIENLSEKFNMESPPGVSGWKQRSMRVAAAVAGRRDSLARWLLTGEGPVPHDLQISAP